jgi:hypothetical protein
MNRNAVFDVLERVLNLAQAAVADAPAPAADPDLVEDLRGLVSALYFVLRRYRDAIATVIGDTGSLSLLRWPSPTCSCAARSTASAMAIIQSDRYAITGRDR